MNILKGGEQVVKVGGLRPLIMYCDNNVCCGHHRWLQARAYQGYARVDLAAMIKKNGLNY